jgi:uncharacterized protein YceK
MIRTGVLVALAILVAALGGCGTVENLCADQNLAFPLSPLAIPTSAYGGIERDFFHCREIFGGYNVNGQKSFPNVLTDASDGPARTFDRGFQLFILGPYLLTLDPLLSAVGDTLTLPWTLMAEVPRNKANPPETDQDWRRIWHQEWEVSEPSAPHSQGSGP